MSRSTSTLEQRQELRRLLAQYPALLSREGPGDEYLVTRKIEMMIENASSKQSTTRTQKQKTISCNELRSACEEITKRIIIYYSWNGGRAEAVCAGGKRVRMR
jgi:hypothetical protein